MVLEQYRRDVVEKLRACREPATARGVLAQADLVLTRSPLTRFTHERFWETLQEDVEVIGAEARRLIDPQMSAALGGVVHAARARISRYRQRVYP